MKIEIIKNKRLEDFKSWPIWECQISKFDWEYNQEEHCYILEGKVEVLHGDNVVRISKDDYVIFPKGLKCTWNVSKPIRKYYLNKK